MAYSQLILPRGQYFLHIRTFYYILFEEQKAMLSRARQFEDLRQSRSSKKDHLKSSLSSRALMIPKSEVSKTSSMNSHYICINCVNKQMSSNKKCREFEREAAEKSRYLNLQKSRLAFEHDLAQSREKKQDEQRRKITDFNKGLIQSHEKQKLNEQRQRQSARRKQKQESEAQRKLLQEELAKKQAVKTLFRNELEEQIQQKNQQKLRQEMKSRYPEPLPQDEDWGQLSKLQREKYRSQLEAQIKENQYKRQLQRRCQMNANSQNQTFMDDMSEKNRKHNEAGKQLRRQLREEQDLYRKNQQQKKRQKLQKRQQQRLDALINQQFLEKQQQQNQLLKNEKINRYKRDIEQQIQENQQRRLKMKNAYRANYYASIGMTQEEIEKRLCNSCQKVYPKKYMTKVKK